MTGELRERVSRSGKIIVITGPSGAGKDAVIEELETLNIKDHGLTRVVTHATRGPRLDRKSGFQEVHGVHYYFCTDEELTLMHQNGELAEEPVVTGTSRKGTSKKELLKVLEGEHKLWRIDLTLAEKIAGGRYFHDQFDQQTADLLCKSTMVVYIDVDQKTLDERRAGREGEESTPEFVERDIQERRIVSKSSEIFKFRLKNPQGELPKTAQILFDSVKEFLTTEIE